MPQRLNHFVSVCLGWALATYFLVATTNAQTVWSGLTYSFSKPDNVDGSLSEYQDVLTENVIFARGSVRGLYNADSEMAWVDDSPAMTRWATTLVEGNQELGEEQIVATNHANLQFSNWVTAFGGRQNGRLHEYIQDLNAVVHLVEDDIYLDINFDYWAVAGGGGFSYMRAEPAATPVTTGDYNHNFVVDAADYTLWRNTQGDEVELGSGADGFADGVIDELDYNFWKERFGNVILAGSGSGASHPVSEPANPVPEPANWLLLLAGLSIMATTRKTLHAGQGIRP